MPAQFNRLGVSFQYPDNWTLDDSDAMLGRRSVTVYSPGGAFWTVAIHSAAADPAQLAAAVVKTMQQEYQGLEVEPTTTRMAGHDMVGYNLAFYYLDLTNTAQVVGTKIANATYTIYCQAEDREYQQVERVFDAITVSLLNGLRPRPSACRTDE